jgi:hypothetical protein
MRNILEARDGAQSETREVVRSYKDDNRAVVRAVAAGPRRAGGLGRMN